MRFPCKSIAVACCVSAALFETGLSAAQPDGVAAQCQDKPNLTSIAITMARVDYMAGAQPDSVKDDVLMVDFNISVRNGGGADADRSRLKYAADIQSSGGQSVEQADGTMDIYWLAAGEAEDNMATIMVSKLGALAGPAGEISGQIVFRAAVDVDGEVDECDESDNSAEARIDLKVEKSVM